MGKLKEVLDNKATWLTLGVFVGSLFGTRAAELVNAAGALVMAIL